jgi:hypothetical protein
LQPEVQALLVLLVAQLPQFAALGDQLASLVVEQSMVPQRRV